MPDPERMHVSMSKDSVTQTRNYMRVQASTSNLESSRAMFCCYVMPRQHASTCIPHHVTALMLQSFRLRPTHNFCQRRCTNLSAVNKSLAVSADRILLVILHAFGNEWALPQLNKLFPFTWKSSSYAPKSPAPRSPSTEAGFGFECVAK